MSSFADVLVGVKSYFETEDKDFARDVLAKVIESFEAKGRDASTAVEQNLVLAAINLVECSSKRRPKAAERLMVELQMTMEFLTGQTKPVAPLDIPTITPEQWSEENPLTLIGAATAAVQLVESGATPDLLEGAVQHLKTALLNIDEAQLGEKALAEVGAEFVRAYKGYKLFGDSMEPVAQKLRDVLSPPVDPFANEPYLYILMRTDLASMNPGKAVAQGSHAANQMVFEGYKKADESPAGDKDGLALERLINFWANATPSGFGTCIVLGVNEREMRDTVAAAQAAGLHANITHDPSYPLWDGTMLHIPLDTCAYIFATKGDAKPFVGKFKLMA